jgi:hypothetical protein
MPFSALNPGKTCLCCLMLWVLLEMHLASAQNSTSSAPKKRGTGWGYTAQNVSSELQALPVSWWYNWGNGIPDADAKATTAVSLSMPPFHTYLCYKRPSQARHKLSQADEMVPAAQVKDIDFVPMIYGNCCGLEDLPSGLPEDATVLLGFNEPNHGSAPGQADMQHGVLRLTVPVTKPFSPALLRTTFN